MTCVNEKCGRVVGPMSRVGKFRYLTYTANPVCEYCRGKDADLESTGIPFRYLDALSETEWKTAEQKRLRDVVKAIIVPEYRKVRRNSVLVVGRDGSGKTHALCWAIAQARQILRKPALFVTEQDLIAEIIETYSSQPAMTTKQVMAKYATVPFLALDDLGCDVETEHSVSKIFNILDTRYRECLPTFISSNYSTSEIAERFSAKVSDDMYARRMLGRLAEWALIVEMNATNRRKRSRAA
jgi:DNA replication protein DnaC